MMDNELPEADKLANAGLDSALGPPAQGDKPDLKVQDGYDDLPVGEVVEPQWAQVELTGDEADVYGTCLMNLITSAIALKQDQTEAVDYELLFKNCAETYRWAILMQDLIERKTASMGLGMIP